MFQKTSLALIQLLVGRSKTQNLNNARRMVLSASQQGAKIVVLPECFNSPYGNKYFPTYAEPLEGGETTVALQKMARDAGVWLIGGSFPEKGVNDKFFNTCTIWGPSGDLLGIHKKVHLFDIDIPGKMTFIESDTLTSGKSLTHINTPYGKIGVGICYDLRFPEMAQIAARQHGVILMVYPGAFNMTTGPLHWDLLLRARAVDNQFYVAGCSPARDPEAEYIVWGHSTIVDPRGQILASVGEGEGIVMSELDLGLVDEARKQIPVSSQRRFDVYTESKEILE